MDDRTKPWQFTWTEFIGAPTVREGGFSAVFPEMAFSDAPLTDAMAVLAKVMGPSFTRTETLLEATAPDGRRLRIVTADADGARRFAAMVADPDSDPSAANLYWDEDYDGGHYLYLADAPLVLLADRGEDRVPEVVGWFYGDILRVDDALRGLGLGKALVMEAARRRGGLPLAGKGSNYSEGGYRSMRAAHREFVMRAVLDGEDVPEAVLADHPDIREAPTPFRP